MVGRRDPGTFLWTWLNFLPGGVGEMFSFFVGSVFSLPEPGQGLHIVLLGLRVARTQIHAFAVGGGDDEIFFFFLFFHLFIKIVTILEIVTKRKKRKS